METETLNDVKAERDRLKKKYNAFVNHLYFPIRDIFWYEQMTAESTEGYDIDEDEPEDDTEDKLKFFCDDDDINIKNLKKQMYTYIATIYRLMNRRNQIHKLKK